MQQLAMPPISSSTHPPLCFTYITVPLSSHKRRLPDITLEEEESDSKTDEHKDLGIWVLNEQHPRFLLEAKNFLADVPGDGDWQTLLSRYIKFKGLVPNVHC